MTGPSPDQQVSNDDWSDLTSVRTPPEIDPARLRAYRLARIREAMRRNRIDLCIALSPISLRYAIDYRNYALFQAHIPTTYLFIPADGPLVLHGAYDPAPEIDEIRPGRALAFFDGGPDLEVHARLFAGDVDRFLRDTGASGRRVAIEYVNPSVTRALLRRDIDVVDGVVAIEEARTVKSKDEVECMRWAVAVAEHAIARVHRALRPGVTELQLWALLNYTNLANNGDWHDGRMLASGPRINPWCQEASARRLEAGDLVGMDTDMIGPFGYFADISRTFHCGPGRPTRRQKQLYRTAVDEIEHNLALIRPGVTLRELQQNAYQTPEEFHANAYTCVFHGVGMSDEYPRVNPIFRGPTPYDGVLEPGMVICVESYIGAVGETDGVKLEQQVLVTSNGQEVLTDYPWDERLLE